MSPSFLTVFLFTILPESVLLKIGIVLATRALFHFLSFHPQSERTK